MEKQINQKQRFSESFEQYSDALFRHAIFRVSNRQVAIDLVQDAYTKTWIQITRGEVIENFQAYLYHVLNNLIIDFYRKKKSISLDGLAENGFDPVGSGSEEIIAVSEKEQVMKYLEKFEESDRAVVVMRYIDGLPVKHIAKVLGETENAISVRLHRLVKKMQKYFSQ